MNLEQAMIIAKGYLPNGGMAFMPDSTIVKSYGYVFFYNSEEFVRTRDHRHGIVGNGPILVMNDGTVKKFGTYQPAEKFLAEFEREQGLSIDEQLPISSKMEIEYALLSVTEYMLDEEIAFMLDKTIVKPYGFVFFYDSKDFIETQDSKYALHDNGPILVTHNGDIIQFPKDVQVEESLAAFERKLRSKALR